MQPVCICCARRALSAYNGLSLLRKDFRPGRTLHRPVVTLRLYWLQATANAPPGITAADVVGSSLMMQRLQPEEQGLPVNAAARLYVSAAAGGCRPLTVSCAAHHAGIIPAVHLTRDAGFRGSLISSKQARSVDAFCPSLRSYHPPVASSATSHDRVVS